MDLLAKIGWMRIGSALGLIVIGFFLAKHVSMLVERAMKKRFSKHQAMLTHRLIFYTLFLIFAISALQQLGFKMTVLLGAAGVFTVALSFASQTAASNLVSGIFLIFERPFKIGDSIEVKNIKGTVDSIDLLSTKIKTSDNMLIRVPNEAIMKSEIINTSYFKTRRVDILIGLSYSCDIEHVKSVLLKLANNCEQVLKDPPGQVVIENFSDYAVQIKFMVWTKTSESSNLKNQLYDLIKQQFDQEKIERPIPLGIFPPGKGISS